MGGSLVALAVMPRLVRNVRPTLLLAAGIFLLGSTAPLYLVGESTAWHLGLTAVRGGGFGLTAAVAVVLVASLSGPARHGTSIGSLGLVTAAAGVGAPPIALSVVDDHAIALCWSMCAIATVASLVIATVPSGRIRAEPASRVRTRAAMRRNAWPLLLFGFYAAAYGATYTLLPLWLAGGAAAHLFVFSSAFAAARFVGGRVSDSRGLSPVLALAAATTPVGIAMMSSVPASLLGLAGAFLAGWGCGSSSIVALLSSIRGLQPDLYTAASSAWNLAFNAGIGLGAVLFGKVATASGYMPTLMALAIVMSAVGGIALISQARATAQGR
jgi:predicted MFS family arabinose efflux permease